MSDIGALLRGLLVASLFFAPGCYKTHTLRPVELAKLDGYDERKPASQPHQVVDDHGEKVTYHTRPLEAAKQIVSDLINKNNGITAGELRDALGVSRKYAIALLEYFDDQQFTRRVGEKRVLR